MSHCYMRLCDVMFLYSTKIGKFCHHMAHPYSVKFFFRQVKPLELLQFSQQMRHFLTLVLQGKVNKSYQCILSHMLRCKEVLLSRLLVFCLS